MPDQLMQPRLLDLKQAAQYLGRSPYSLRTLLWRKEIPVVVNKTNGNRQKIWLDRKDLDQFIEAHKITL
jgi:hypothetical protein